MSKIALTPSATGTGVFTISSPATNTNRTLTLPDITGTLVSTDASGNVGIGTTSPEAELHIAKSTSGGRGGTLVIENSHSSILNNEVQITFLTDSGASLAGISNARIKAINTDAGNGAAALTFTTWSGSAEGERMRIDSSGNVLVGMTTANTGNNGVGLRADGLIHAKRANVVANFNRQTTDGTIVEFAKDNTVVGIIGTSGGDLTVGTNGAGLIFTDPSRISPWNVSTNTISDNLLNLGETYGRFAVIYAGTGSINTSDRNEKQDIDVMSEAETRVAVACKGLMRKFRWKDAVAEKGDDARIHFGIIAQDLQDAFAAEGLDASRYAMFCSDTWWETQTDVSAVEAVVEVLDEEGNVVTEAVEAKEAYIRTDHYDTLEEAPEGATERTRLGVRYSELLAFIIGAL